MLGNLTRDCELRYLPTGGAVCTTGIATNRKFKKQDGSQGEDVCFIVITFFGRTAEIANQYLKRGSQVLVEGRLKLDQWTDQNGVKHSKHSIQVESLQMIGDRGQGEDSQGGGNYGTTPNVGYTPQQRQPQQPQRQPQRQPQSGQQGQLDCHDIPDIDINDDEIPF